METTGPPTIFYKMKFTLRAFTTLSLALCATLPMEIFAENWKSVGEGFYVDVDSSKRRGDIGDIDVRHGSSIDRNSFDCKRKMYISSTGKQTFVGEWDVLNEMLKEACKKWYEVWRR